jgi:hypothetical protein
MERVKTSGRSDYDRVSSWRMRQRREGARAILVNLTPNESRALDALAGKGQRTALIGRLLLEEARRRVKAGEIPPGIIDR